MRLSPTLSVYIGRQFLVALAGVLLVIMGVILLFDLIELIRRAAGRDGVGFGLLMGMAVLKLPNMVHTILPFAVMIGAMIAFWRLTRSHELVVARASGISVWQFLAPVLSMVLILGVIEVTLFNPLAATLYGRYKALEETVLLNRASALDLSESGLWLREGNHEQQSVVHAEDVRQDGLILHLRDVQIFLFEGGDLFRRRIDAASGTLVSGAFELTDGWEMQAGRPSVHFDHLRIPTELTLERVQDNFAAPEVMSFWQLPAFIEFFERAGFAATKHRMYLQSLLASPMLLCGMVLVASLFSLRPNMRSGGLLGRIGGGVAMGFGVYFFSRVVYAFGLSGTLPQGLAAWSPALVASLVGLTGLLHLEDG